MSLAQSCYGTSSQKRRTIDTHMMRYVKAILYWSKEEKKCYQQKAEVLHAVSILEGK